MHERWADEVAAALGPVVAGRHREIDALGRLPDDVVAAMHTSGLFRTWVPDELGGRDATMAEGLELIEELSRLDAALGWVTMINITTSWIAGSIGRDAAREVFGPDRSVAAGTTAPMGRAVEVDGGLRLSGIWTAGRTLLIELSPREKVGEYFGLYGITTKLSVIGSAVVGVLQDVVSKQTGSDLTGWKVAIGAQAGPLLLGILFLALVKKPQPGPASATS